MLTILRFACISLLASGSLSYPTTDATPGNPTPISTNQAIHRAVRFLVKLYDPAVQLLPEYQGSKVYWLFHDNYLAQKVLAKDRSALAKRIGLTLQLYRKSYDGAINVLFDPNLRLPPFHATRLILIARRDGALIKNEQNTPKLINNWRDYTDLLFLAAISNVKRNRAFAMECYHQALAMWDGMGFMDAPAMQLYRYSIFKLALALIAARQLQARLPIREKILHQLIALQDRSGGFVTDYNKDDKPIGVPNVETTCLAILALR